MRDYYLVADGQRTPVAELKTAEIQAILKDGFTIISGTAAHGETVENITDRLRIELTVRRIEGRL